MADKVGLAHGSIAEGMVTSTPIGATKQGLDIVLYDGNGNELELRQENENWNAGDHGILIFGRDIESNPNKYRSFRLDADGRLMTHPQNAEHDDFQFKNLDYNSSGSTDTRSAFGLLLPSTSGAVAGGTDAAPIKASNAVVSNVSSAGTPITTNTNTQIIAGPAGQNHLRIFTLWAQNSSATASWCYWGNGSGVKTIPFYLAQGQGISFSLNGSWELSSSTGLYLQTITNGVSIEWYASYKTLPD